MRRDVRRAALAAIAVGGLLVGALAGGVQAATAAPGGDQPVDVVVHTGDLVQDDYLGVGVNVIPWSLMGDTATLGYDEADWQVDVERILTLRPKVARFWFQIDWMELQKGQYDFDSPEMKAVYRYLDAFKQAGTEIELNFGWKVGERIHDWFTIPGVEDPYISAPADLPAYGRSASALLQNLWGRGYENVKYLTYYNEPNGSWDFEAPGDEKAYYAQMAQAVSDQLVADGIRDRIEIWGPEEVSAPDWTAFMEQNAPDAFDGYSFHLYGEAYSSLDDIIAARTSVANGKPVSMTEFGWASPEASVWETGYANYVIDSANKGVHTNLVWQLNGVMTDDPRGDTNGDYNLWDSVILGLEPSPAFYEAGPLLRYIPAHSSVYATEVSSPDARATAFRDGDGEWTVLVETKDGAAKDVTVRFDGDKSREASKGSYTRIAMTDADAQPEQNALLPASSGSLKVKKGAFTDREVTDAHTQLVYTQAPAQTQVALDDPQIEVVGGSTTKLGASVIDGHANVTWSVIGSDDGTVSPSGKYTAPQVTTERTVAITATSRSDGSSYAVQQVLVTPAHRDGVTDAPVFSLPAGQYDSLEGVTITSPTEGASIHYTTDGSQPTAESPEYTGQIVLPALKTTYLRAIAIAPGQEASGTTSRLYKVLDVQNAPDGYTFCAYDGQQCAFDGEQSVVYGSDGLFAYGTFAGGVECTAEAFGSDPNPGGDNRCFVNPVIPDEVPAVTVFNAGFEKPATSSAANGPMVNGWTFSVRSGVQSNTSPFVPAFPAPEGERTAYLKTDSGLASSIEQTVRFPAGSYAITFQAANRSGFGGQQEFDVTVDGTVVAHVVPSMTGEYALYTSDTFTVEAGEHTIAFVATTTDGDNTAFVDQVAVVSAP
ncbi:chitobiase/beta-hexosaminidase C-terminal domain-containing protein [Herbiconiux sp. KACC 21604]|uniref:chitobiase/beta-hexosaminidase C-terminal domain-containing protein n=1 Tax=unclassified Herbiconiux TaxID=2618217 RepID=UPI001491CC47|nr:chitobiase/beta-hexosaminidase C-terminal domain-containing protein [Herbiconiux sp. SALV-R1]QJU55729.1 hypothetical protein HL652_20330 [Herbiconiux sp. SALV-R1]WPO86937.1 chitobiase/beta-hexosaminidase C-terminal domain-containing protein [Herbiconiux sp. KACC 21604]